MHGDGVIRTGEGIHYFVGELVLLRRALEYLFGVVVEDFTAQRHQIVLGHVLYVPEHEHWKGRFPVFDLLSIELRKSLDEIRIARRLQLQHNALGVLPAKHGLDLVLVEQQLY